MRAIVVFNEPIIAVITVHRNKVWSSRVNGPRYRDIALDVPGQPQYPSGRTLYRHGEQHMSKFPTDASPKPP